MWLQTRLYKTTNHIANITAKISCYMVFYECGLFNAENKKKAIKKATQGKDKQPKDKQPKDKPKKKKKQS